MIEERKYFRNGYNRHCLNLWKKYKRNARRRNIQFKLSIKEFANIMLNKRCFYCGVFPVPARHFYHGLDRVNNKVCYVAGNVVPCCSVCNYMKGSLTLDEFLGRCEQVAKRKSRIVTDFEQLQLQHATSLTNNSTEHSREPSTEPLEMHECSEESEWLDQFKVR